MSNELPDIYAPSNFDQGSSTRSGCFLRTPMGCAVFGCVGLLLCGCLVIVGPILGIVGVAGLLLTNPASETGSETFHLENPETARLEINHENAVVTITGGSNEEIVVNYELTAYGFNDSSAQSNLDELEVNFTTQADGTINITVDGGDSFWNSIHDLDLNITVPFEMQDIVVSPAKDVNITDVQANFIIKTDSYDLTLTDVTGTYTLETTSGSITFNGAFLGKTDSTITSESGDMRITVQGDGNVSYQARTTSGNVRCPDTGAGLKCSGTIGVGSANLTATSSSGDIIILTSR